MRGLPEKLRDHFDNPRHVGEPAGGVDLRGEARNAACGDHLVIYLRVTDGAVAAAGFRARGCPATLATGSAACDLMGGLAADAGLAAAVGRRFEEGFGAPQPMHRHALTLVAEALRAARAYQEPA